MRTGTNVHFRLRMPCVSDKAEFASACDKIAGESRSRDASKYLLLTGLLFALPLSVQGSENVKNEVRIFKLNVKT